MATHSGRNLPFLRQDFVYRLEFQKAVDRNRNRLDVDEQTAAGRLSPLLDRMERKGAAFHRRVREGYHLLAEQRPADTVLIDATVDEDAVFEALLQMLQRRLTN